MTPPSRHFLQCLVCCLVSCLACALLSMLAPGPAAAQSDAAPGVSASPAGSATPTEAVTGHIIAGRITLEERRKSSKRPDPSEIIVYYMPNDRSGLTLQPTTHTLSTERKRFEPGVMAITVGSTIEFPNRDEILHNVFSLSGNNGFDLGLFGKGESRSVTFDKSGLVLVHCNVHHSMQADILVLDTPFFARADSEGEFKIAGVPAGSGRLYFWHPQARVGFKSISVPEAVWVTESLQAVRVRVPKHTNKFGRSYRPRRPSR